MILIGGPCPIVLHPPKQFILQIIVNLKKSDFSSLSPPAELTIVQLHHRSTAWASSGLAALQILCYLALVLSPGPFIERWAFPRIEGPAPHFWEKLTGSAPRSEESARAKALVKLPFPKIEGPSSRGTSLPLPLHTTMALLSRFASFAARHGGIKRQWQRCSSLLAPRGNWELRKQGNRNFIQLVLSKNCLALDTCPQPPDNLDQFVEIHPEGIIFIFTFGSKLFISFRLYYNIVVHRECSHCPIAPPPFHWVEHIL